MSAPIGFVITSHHDAGQVHRLVHTLHEMYDAPPIAIHHAFSQSPFDRTGLPGSVRFVEPHVETQWAKWPFTEAVLRAIALLYEHDVPEWFVTLSGTDYPVRSAADVLAELQGGAADAYIDHRLIRARRPNPTDDDAATNPCAAHFGSAKMMSIQWHRYVGAQLWIPWLRFRPPKMATDLRHRVRLGRHTVFLPFAARRVPYGPHMAPYAGEFWLTANARAAHVLLEPSEQHLALRRHLRRAVAPEETYFQTVLCNTPGFVVDKDNKRFTRWAATVGHPDNLTKADLDDIAASTAHFARKFVPNDPLLDHFDQLLLPSRSM